MKRYFNTSGPNNPHDHYTLPRQSVVAEGLKLVKQNRYFTIWAPRQTGKSTYFRLLADDLVEQGYKVSHINLENFKDASVPDLFDYMTDELSAGWGKKIEATNIQALFNVLRQSSEDKCVWIIDEIEGLNPNIFNQFLHTIRNLYHSREKHCLKSVLLVGVTNILGVVSDNASPFNIADNLPLDYFTHDEVRKLLELHEAETEQQFSDKVKDSIYHITAGQPGLVNGFAQKLITSYPDVPQIEQEHYLEVENWYLTEAIDKNFENIHTKAQKYRSFVDRLLFTESEIPFNIDRESTKLLHTNGLIKKGENGNISFWVPFYKKRLYNAFYPYTNGETKQIRRSYIADDFVDAQNLFNIDKLVTNYKEYVKRRSFRYFLEKDKATNKYIGLKESALLYSFETFITAIVQELDGKTYREADTGLGKSDLIINITGKEFLIETKVYYSPSLFMKGKKQLAYYCKSLGLDTGVYMIFLHEQARLPQTVCEAKEQIEGVEINTYLVLYDDDKW